MRFRFEVPPVVGRKERRRAVVCKPTSIQNVFMHCPECSELRDVQDEKDHTRKV